MWGETAIADHFTEQAGWCRGLGSPFTADLLLAMRANFDTRGIIHALTHAWSGNPRKDALGLRLAGALHYAVLSGRAPELMALYPASKPDTEMKLVWRAAEAWLRANSDFVRDFLQSAPQTNETRRAIALLPGFLELAHHCPGPMHVYELGASAGLNQNFDRFNYETPSWSRAGTSDVTIRTRWHGAPPLHLGAKLEVAGRAACDLSPFDLSDDDAVHRLTCYAWPDQSERLSRLACAILLARETGVRVDKASAGDWLEHQLRARPTRGLSVIFHSVFLIYPPRDEIARIVGLIEAAGRAATEERPLAWLCYESEALFGGDKTSPMMYTRLQVWPGGAARNLVRSDGHVTRVDALG